MTIERIQDVLGPAMGVHPEGSSLWWIERLSARMDARNEWLKTLRAYYRGTQSTWKLASKAHRLAFGYLFDGLKANMAKPIVDAPEHRLRVESILYKDDQAATDAAWDLWMANNMDAQSSVAHIEALSVGECPVIVWMDEGAEFPRITVEDPLQVYVERDVADPTQKLAALKRWSDADTGDTWAVLYLPDYVEWWSMPAKSRAWQYDEARSGENPISPEIPVVTLVNMPRLVDAVDANGSSRYTRGEAEHEAVLPLIDAYNKTMLDLLVTSEYAAFPQRFAIGVILGEEGYELETDGDPAVDELGISGATAAGSQGGVDRMVSTESPDAKFGQFDVADLTPYIETLKQLEREMATITHTPHRKLVPPPTSVPPSGESVRLSDEGLTAKVRRRHDMFGIGWREVDRLGAVWQGASRAIKRSAIGWRDPEIRTESEHMDALTKLATLAVPNELLWEMVPLTPEDIQRIKDMSEPEPEPGLDSATGTGAFDGEGATIAPITITEEDPNDDG